MKAMGMRFVTDSVILVSLISKLFAPCKSLACLHGALHHVFTSVAQLLRCLELLTHHSYNNA